MSIQSEKRTVFSEINITPLTDIFLVLLIIMMVVAPTFQSIDKSIKVPEINSGVSIEQKDAIVSITADGEYFINSQPTTANNLYSDLEKLKDTLSQKVVIVKADASVKSSLIMEVMRAAEAAEYEKLIIAGEPLNKSEAKALSENQENAMIEEQEQTNDSNEHNIGALPGD